MVTRIRTMIMDTILIMVATASSATVRSGASITEEASVTREENATVEVNTTREVNTVTNTPSSTLTIAPANDILESKKIQTPLKHFWLYP